MLEITSFTCLDTPSLGSFFVIIVWALQKTRKNLGRIDLLFVVALPPRPPRSLRVRALSFLLRELVQPLELAIRVGYPAVARGSCEL